MARSSMIAQFSQNSITDLILAFSGTILQVLQRNHPPTVVLTLLNSARPDPRAQYHVI